MTALVSVGVAATLGPDAIARLATAVEAAGLHALWVNDTPGGDSLAALTAAAAVTERLVLATGVVPVDRRPVDSVRDALAALPQERLVLGIGSGGRGPGALARVRDAVERLRDTTSARVLVGALGPRMRRLGAVDADGVLLSWLTPGVAADQAREARDAASGRSDANPPHVALYVRTALDPEAVPRMSAEAERYGSFPAYAANFERLGIRPDETVIRPDDSPRRLAAYREGVDEVVLRAIVASDDLDAYAGFIEQAAALL